MIKEIEELNEQLSLLNQKVHTYQSEKSQNVYYYNALIAGLCQISWSKQLFKHNKDLAEFYNHSFHISFPEYVSKNRALLIGRSIRYFSECNNIHEIKGALNKLYKLVYNINQNKTDVTWGDVIDSIKMGDN